MTTKKQLSDQDVLTDCRYSRSLCLNSQDEQRYFILNLYHSATCLLCSTLEQQVGPNIAPETFQVDVPEMRTITTCDVK